MKKLNTLSILLVTFFFTTTVFAGLLDKDVELSTLPPVVQEAILQNTQGGDIKNVEERLTTEKGLKVYKVEVKKADGTEIEYEIDESGRLIDLEKD